MVHVGVLMAAQVGLTWCSYGCSGGTHMVHVGVLMAAQVGLTWYM